MRDPCPWSVVRIRVRNVKYRSGWNMKKPFHSSVSVSVYLRIRVRIRDESRRERFFTYADHSRTSVTRDRMPKSKLSSPATCEKLIELVREHPVVFNSRLPDYKDIDVVRNTWESITQALEVDITCKYSATSLHRPAMGKLKTGRCRQVAVEER